MFAIRYPFLTIFSKIYSSGLFSNNLKKEIKFLISKDFVEILRSASKNSFFIKEFIETFVSILSNLIIFFLFLI